MLTYEWDLIVSLSKYILQAFKSHASWWAEGRRQKATELPTLLLAFIQICNSFPKSAYDLDFPILILKKIPWPFSVQVFPLLIENESDAQFSWPLKDVACEYECRCPWRPKTLDDPGTRVKGSCELYDCGC